MANQKCLIVDINGQYYSRFGQAGDKVLSLNDHRSEHWNFWNENASPEFFAETLAEVNQDSTFFSAGGRELLTFSLTRWATSSSNEWVFLIVPVYNLAELSPLLRLWFELAVDGVLQRDVSSADPHFWLVADELPAIGKIPSLEKLLAQARRYKASVVAGYQVSSQLQNIYGRAAAEAIIHNLQNKICFRNPEPSTAMELDLPARELQNLSTLQAYLKIYSFAPTRIQFDAWPSNT